MSNNIDLSNNKPKRSANSDSKIFQWNTTRPALLSLLERGPSKNMEILVAAAEEVNKDWDFLTISQKVIQDINDLMAFKSEWQRAIHWEVLMINTERRNLWMKTSKPDWMEMTAGIPLRQDVMTSKKLILSAHWKSDISCLRNTSRTIENTISSW